MDELSKIVQSYNVDNGQWLANTTNMGTGIVILPPMNITDDAFKHKLRYYTQPAISSSTTTAPKKTNLTPLEQKRIQDLMTLKLLQQINE